jgi:hypothetical protein
LGRGERTPAERRDLQISRWSTHSTIETAVTAASIWASAYADAEAWPLWNEEIRSARLDGPLALGARARVRFETGLRLSFRVVEYEEGRVFTDESRLPGARMGHRHLLESVGDGTRLTNTIYIEGRLAWLWRRLVGPRAAAALPVAQEKIVTLSRGKAPETR